MSMLLDSLRRLASRLADVGEYTSTEILRILGR